MGPTTDLLLIMKNSGAGVNVTVLAVLAKNAPGIDRQSAFPVGEPLKVEFTSDNYKVVVKATQLLQITDNFSNSIRDFSISTNLSVKRLAGGAEILVRTKAVR